MGLFDFLHHPDIGQGVRNCRETPGAVLLDVRTPQEYRQGHIPGSVNVPLQQLSQVSETIPGKDTPVFVYCYSGARSRQAVEYLRQAGYTRAENIGGISAWKGKKEQI